MPLLGREAKRILALAADSSGIQDTATDWGAEEGLE
jgi:hypothetical protein